MARQAENSEVTGAFVTPVQTEAANWVRTGDETAVPTLFRAVLLLADPEVGVHLLIRVEPGGRAYVCEFSLAPSEPTTPITTSMLRRIPVDALMREAVERATVKVKPRPDFHPRAFQVPGDPDNEARVSPEPAPLGRGREVPRDRVERAAQVYREALAAGSNAPAEVVAATLGYSRATAARDIRAARNRKPPLLPPPGEESALKTPEATGQPGDAITGTGTITRVPMAEFIAARERIEKELGMQRDSPERVEHPGIE